MYDFKKEARALHKLMYGMHDSKCFEDICQDPISVALIFAYVEGKADEREACAKIAETEAYFYKQQYSVDEKIACTGIADKIRARK